jgi:hypothetical protein
LSQGIEELAHLRLLFEPSGDPSIEKSVIDAMMKTRTHTAGVPWWNENKIEEHGINDSQERHDIGSERRPRRFKQALKKIIFPQSR